MSNTFRKNFQLCSFFNFRCLPTIQSPPPPPNDDDDDDDHHIHSSSTTSLLKNFNTIYQDFTTTTASTSKSFTPSSTTDDHFFSSSDDSDSDNHQSPPDFAAVFASQRFFFSSPGSSNSIIESTDTKTEDSDMTKMMDDSTTGGVRVRKFSVNPYDDFRRSMQEMLEARDVLVDGRSDLEYLHELLLCYLALNPKHAHKFIIEAFTDLVIDLLSSPETMKIGRPNDILRRRVV
ncbi:transcription repressor OFP12 [Ziziphus jujuba]|uniref:Transcription repressor n=2 Tax=Ziziphus jujuba TaxID=326968 RepID=A0A6P4A0E7_ZIZJJ|nr:transcription repressor OFP12 [Ziziphus jujuba]KAH7522308.1 hypothetical protein FEM48_Zijuj07G0124600 [Ziziphus jujuba var. spinosa]